MKMVLRAPGRGVDGQRNGAVRHVGPPLHAHKVTRLPCQPEEIRCLRLSQQRAFGAVDTVRGHQQVLQRPVAVLEHHVARIWLHLRARCRVTVVQLVGHTLVENDMTQRIRITRFHPVHAACGKGDNDQNQ